MYEVPNFLENRLNNQYGNEITERIMSGYKANRKTTLRVNSIKNNKDGIKKILCDNNINIDEVSFYDNAMIVKNADENDIRNISIYDNGEIYLQSLSSMIPVLVLNPKEGENILDMAAAPGGKTTQIAAMSNNKALITACERNAIRFDRLKYNIDKQGASKVNLIKQDSRDLDDFFSFDKILLDAPCSGSGTISLYNDNLNKYFTEALIEKSKKLQLSLLRKALKLLRKDGEMVYSTCSILVEENEDIVNQVLKEFNAEIVPVDYGKFEEIPKLPVKIDGTMCVCPNELYEGFFIAKIKKLK